MDVLKQVLDPRLLLEQFGYLGLFLIVFAESGLFFGFFFPGDSLLLIAGVLAATGYLDIRWLIPLVFIAAFLGDQVGYWSGSRFGRKLFDRTDSWLFKREYVQRSEEFFAQHGPQTVILGRFIPIVRTFTPILAGIGKMPYRAFVGYNLLGAVLWGIGIMLAGYGLGNVPHIDRYLHLIIGVIIVLSILPAISHIRGSSQKK